MSATTTPAVVNDSSMPAASIAPPRIPDGPTAASSAMPATAGGSTSGSSISVTTSALPRNERVASR